MKKFIKEIFIIIISVLVIGEALTRAFQLKSQHFDFITEDKDGYYSYKPFSKGEYVFGKPPRIIRSNFRINDIGFNSELDFEKYDVNKINIAFLGDSFVESFHVNNHSTFSSILMTKNEKIQSYDFGFSGYSISDYMRVYNANKLENFDHVFIMIGKNDIDTNSTVGKFDKNKEDLRKLYNSLHFVNYLNLNHNFLLKIVNLFKLKSNKLKTNNLNNKITSRQRVFLKKQNIILIPRDEETFNFFAKQNITNTIKIKHKRKPFDFGYMNGHWNENGRKNIIDSIIPYLNNYLN